MIKNTSKVHFLLYEYVHLNDSVVENISNNQLSQAYQKKSKNPVALKNYILCMSAGNI